MSIPQATFNYHWDGMLVWDETPTNDFGTFDWHWDGQISVPEEAFEPPPPDPVPSPASEIELKIDIINMDHAKECLCACFNDPCWNDFFADCCQCCSSSLLLLPTETMELPFWEFDAQEKKQIKQSIANKIKKLISKIRFIKNMIF